MLNLRYLEAFYQVASKRSFVRAAEALRVAPSAITRQIQIFEKQYGQELIVRSPKSLALTVEGERLFRAADNFFAECQSREVSRFSIGCLQSIFEQRLRPDMVAHPSFWQKNLQNLSIGGAGQLEKELVSGQLDLILTNRRPSRKGLTRLDWLPEKYLVACKTEFSKSDYQKKTWVVIEAFLDIFQGMKIKPQVIIQVNSFNAGLEMIKAGLGLGILPARLEVCSELFTRPLSSQIERQDLWGICRQQENKNLNLKKLIERLGLRPS